MENTRDFELFDFETKEKVIVSAIRKGKEWLTRCVKHDDKVPSLSINAEKGLFNCFGCGFSGSLWDESKRGSHSLTSRKGEIAYSYNDGSGTLRFQVVRVQGADGKKKFFARRPDPERPGEWINNITGVELVPYRLSELLKGSDPVFVVEGEKDVDNLYGLGLTATCNPFGAGKWKDDYNKFFTGRNIVVIPDDDPQGKSHVIDVVKNLISIVNTIKILEIPNLPEGGDVSDFLNSGHTGEDLLKLVDDVEVVADIKDLIIPWSCDETLLNFNKTDVGNAESFKHLYGNDFLYIKQKKTWVKFNSIRWKEANLEAKEYMVNVLREKIRQALIFYGSNSKELKDIVSWCLRSEEKSNITDALDLTTIWLSKDYNDFDVNPWLFCSKSGVIDLQTGEPKTTSKEEMILKATRVNYDPDAQCPRWLVFMEEIFSEDAELIDFIQRSVGYSLTGLTREQCLFILYGKGNNGKSTFLGILQELIGDYGQSASFSTFKDTKYDYIPNDVARMVGKRFIKATEVKESARLNEERIKLLTGEDVISARFLYNEFFDFRLIGKIWLAVNHKPIIRGTDKAIWRRIRLIPFLEDFEERKDNNLSSKLEKELSGILNWAIEGCLKYQREGLEPVETVKRATEEYREESDIIKTFINENIIEDVTVRTPASELYERYKEWASRNGEYVMTNQYFGRSLVEKGYKKEKVGSYIYYYGIKLLERRNTDD